MGGDTPPDVLFSAVLKLHKELGDAASLTIFATPEIITSLKLSPSIRHVHAEEVITMEEDPLFAVRRKQNASMSRGIHSLCDHSLDAFVSVGNTGALLANAMLSLPKLPGIERPALLTLMPTMKHEMAVLDVGANISPKAEDFVQFAAMGIAYQKCLGISTPTVGLLNIGAEAKKGTPELKKAYQLLSGQEGFIGNVEGRDAFKGDVDVLVTDGFTGNVFLKTAEGIATVILDQLERTAALEPIRAKLHYTEYPGAILCGVEGIVIKCHGDATATTLYHGMKGAYALVKNQFLTKIRLQLQ
jgi:Fatty acid/phospholipid biosynthesis enzyme